jgi:hypothetical protein
VLCTILNSQGLLSNAFAFCKTPLLLLQDTSNIVGVTGAPAKPKCFDILCEIMQHRKSKHVMPKDVTYVPESS